MFACLLFNQTNARENSKRAYLYVFLFVSLAFELWFHVKEYKIQSAINVLLCERMLFHLGGMLPAIFL